MRNLAIFPLLCLCLVSRAGTVDPTYTFSDFTDHPLNVSRVTLTPLARDAYYSGSILSTKPLVYTKAAYPTLTNGTFTATNLVNGYAYRVEIADSYQTTTVTNYFGTNVTGSVDAADYLTPMLGLEQGVVVRAFFESTPAETGSATNVFFLASTNITPSTSGGSNVFTVTGQVPLATAAVTATNNANQVEIPNSFTNGAIAYVRTNGNDTTARLGRVDLPFASPAAAYAAAPAYSTIKLGIGRWTWSNVDITNVTVLGEDRFASILVYSNSNHGWRTRGTVTFDGISVVPNYTNAALTYTFRPVTGTLRIINCGAVFGQSDIIFSDAGSTAISVELLNNAWLDSPWDTFNGFCGYNSTYRLQNNTWNLRYDPTFGEYGHEWLRNIHGYNVYASGNTVVITNHGVSKLISGTDLSRSYFVGNTLIAPGASLFTPDALTLPPFMAGNYVIVNDSVGKQRQPVARIPELRLFSPWDNEASIVATNKSAAYRGQTIAVAGAGSSAVNGLYVLESDGNVIDNNFFSSQRIYTNTSNNRLKLGVALTNQHPNTYVIATNAVAAGTHPDNWTQLYTSVDFATWDQAGGALPVPVASNYWPALTLYVDSDLETTNVTIRGSGDYSRAFLLLEDVSEIGSQGTLLVVVTNQSAGRVFSINDAGDVVASRVSAGTFTSGGQTLTTTGFFGTGSGLTNIPATAMAGGSQGQVVTWHVSGAIWSNPPASGGSFTLTMNPNQFGQAGGTTNFISGATTTNINHWKTLVLRSEDAANDITVTNHSQKLKINSTANPYTADTEIGEDIKARTFYGVSNNITGGISAGSITATSVTNSGGTASRIVIHDANKKLIGATASGAVPIDADGTATTFAQINSLGNVITTNAATLTSSTFLVGNGARGASAQAGYTTSTVATNPPMAGAWAGPTNTLAMKPNGEYPVYPTATDCAITNLSNGNGWATVGFSNSSASTIVVRLTDARIRIIGPASTNALNIPSGKVGFVSGLVNTWTNAMTGVQQ